MPTPLWSAALIAMTGFLVSCGGGGDNNSSPLTAASCDSNTLWAAPRTDSGLGIPDNSNTGISVTWDNQGCALQSVNSVSLDICLTHPQPSDLQWQITSPSSNVPVDITVPVNWNTTGAVCDLVNGGNGKLQRIDLLQSVSSTVATRGLWTLKVRDSRQGDVGTLVQWRLLIEGLR